MMPIPAGDFLMGSPEDEPKRGADEGPRHRVTFAQSFAIGKYEVTFAEWDACVAVGGCRHKPADEGWGRGTKPVINVSWDDAVEYVTWLARTTGKPYRLPTEAEWEYAARAVTSSTADTDAFATGPTITFKQANFDANFLYGPVKVGTYRQKPLAVGSTARNPFGLYEMHGNVWEWVADCYQPTYVGAPTDGSAVRNDACEFRIMRGGAWNYYAWTLRSAARHASVGDVRLNNAGLRVALTLPAAAPSPAVEKGR